MFYKIARALASVLTKFLFFLSAKGTENVPKTGGAVLCANHRSAWDPIFIAVILRRPLAFIAKEELFKNKLLGFAMRHLNCYPVRRDGGDLAVVKTAIRLLRQGELLVIFPEGQRVKKGMKPSAKSGAFRLAAMTGVPIVPIGIRGDIRPFHKVRLLVDAQKDMSVYKGERLSEDTYTDGTKTLMQKIYSLAETEHML